MDKENLYKQILMDHYNNPQNKVSQAPEGYEVKKGINPSCGDELEIYIKFDGEKVEDLKFNGEGCSICCSSASILTEELKGLSSGEVLEKVDNFNKMLTKENFDEDLFEDAIAFEGIAKFPARYKCAFLSWQTIKDILAIER